MKLVYFMFTVMAMGLSYMAGYNSGYNNAYTFQQGECNKLMEHTYGKQ